MPPQFKSMDELKQYLAILESRIDVLENKQGFKQTLKDESKTELARLLIKAVVTVIFFMCNPCSLRNYDLWFQ
jgi:hypothetical protein